MAKKKTSAMTQLLHTPVSLPLLGMLGLIGTGLLSLNLSLFINQPKETVTIPSTISQKTLQDVLGTSISIGEKPRTKSTTKNDPESAYWQEIITSKPDYRDAYITLAVIAFNNRDCQNTRYYIDKAYDLDPDNKSLQELVPHLKSCLETAK